MYAEELLTMQDELCPPEQKLRSYLSGRLETDDLDKLEAHLHSCQACEQAATAIENEPDTFVDLLQSQAPPAMESSAPEETSSSARPDAKENTASVVRFPLDGEIASYELLRELGSGGMGAVYLARHTKLDKQVAIKLLPALPAKMPEFVARFEREMRAAGRLDHPAIVRTTDAGEAEGVHYLVMDAIDGLDLSRIARSTDQMSIADACDVARQAALGLAHAHENGIVHRDVKPSNLMLDADGQLRILDFGLAQIGLWERGSAEITTVGQLMGTLDYMAPEQAERGGAVDYRADLYSLGATLFRLLSGRPPLAAAPDMTPLEKLRLLSTHTAPKLSTLRPDTPPQLVSLTSSLLARSPDQRPASASHAAEMLEPFCDGSQLGSLVARARIEAKPPESSIAVAQLMAKPASTEQQKQQSSDADRTSGFTSWFAWAGALAIAAASIWFVVETGKGQLVIESVDASVNVSLRKDDQVLDELRIEPGTKVTRLWGGEYEITLDTGSDSFSVSQHAFTIRRGETVVARITSNKPTVTHTDVTPALSMQAAAADDSLVAGSQPTDRRLDEIVYKGETLDTWLRRIKYERSSDQLAESLNAVGALASPELQELIDPVMLELLQKQPKQWRAAMPMLQTNGSGFYSRIQPLFDATSDRESVDALATTLSYTVTAKSEGLSSAAAAAPLLDWIAENFDMLAPCEKLRFLVEGILAGKGLPEAQCMQENGILANLIAIIHAGEAKAPEMVQVVDRFMFFRTSKVSSWPERTRVEAIRRALRIVVDDRIQQELRHKASVVLVESSRPPLHVPSEEQKRVVDVMRKWLHFISDAPSFHLSIREPRDFGIPSRYWFPENRGMVNPHTTAMYIIAELGLAAELEKPLTRLHHSVEELAIEKSGSQYFGSFDSDSGDIEVARTIFLRTGELLGIPDSKLEARLSEIRPADRRRYADAALRRITVNKNANYVADGIYAADLFLSSREADIAIPAFVNLINREDLNEELGKMAIGLLNRVAGEDFFQHLAGILRSNPKFAGVYGSSLWTIPELGCENADSLAPLFEWADEIFEHREDAERAAALALLSSLLYDRTRTIADHNEKLREFQQPGKLIAARCQQAIIERLGTYSYVTNDNLWLKSPPFSSSQSGTAWDAPFLNAQAKHAIKALEQSSDPQLACRALMVLKSYGSRPLPDEVVARLPEILRPKLTRAIEDIDAAAASFHNVPEAWVHLSAPTIMRLKGPRTVSNSASANETLLAIEVAGVAGLADELSPQLAGVYELAEVREVTTSYADQGWRWQDLTGTSRMPDAAIQAMLLSTGELLGKDMAELRRRPVRLAAEAKKLARITARRGDTLAVYIEGILPAEGSPIPVMQAGTADPVVGYPIPVSSGGTIVVPMLPPIQVESLQLAAIQELILKSYEDKAMFKVDKLTVSVDMLSKAGDKQELRSLSSPSAAAKTP